MLCVSLDTLAGGTIVVRDQCHMWEFTKGKAPETSKYYYGYDLKPYAVGAYANEKWEGVVNVPEYVNWQEETYAWVVTLTGQEWAHIKQIGADAFVGYDKITKLVLPEGLQHIKPRAFKGCAALQNVNFPSTLFKIEDSVCEGCPSLRSIELPGSVTELGKRLFFGCTGLVNAKVDSKYISVEMFEGCTALRNLTICGGVESIDQYAFRGCTSLADVVIPEGVKEIGLNAFSRCTALTNVYIASSVTKIGPNPFYACDKLANVTCMAVTPPTVEMIGDSESPLKNAVLFVPRGSKSKYENAIYWQDFKEIVEFENELEMPNFWHFDIKDSTVTNLTPSCDYFKKKLSGAIEIPAYLYSCGRKLEVASIGENAFKGCIAIESVTIPSTVEYIGKSAFEGCSKLTNVPLPNSLGCIADKAFSGCTALSVVTIPSGVRSIGSEVFMGCTALTKVLGCSGLTNIGPGAFMGCTALNAIAGNNGVVIPKNVSRIEEYVFKGCSSLKTLTLHDRVTTICKYAFLNCTALKSLSIPTSVKSFGYNAFGGCTALVSVDCYWVKPEYSLALFAFSAETAKKAVLNVPYKCKTEYENAGWRFTTIKERTPAEVRLTMGDEGIRTFAAGADLNFSSFQCLKAYIVTGFDPETGDMELRQVDRVPAYTGVVLKGEAGSYYIPRIKNLEVVYDDNLLVGVTQQDTEVAPAAGGCTNYILSDGIHGINFYTLSENSIVTVGRAYLKLPASANRAVSIMINFDVESTTGIGEVTGIGGDEKAEGNQWYTLEGRKLAGCPTQKGIYIRDGKKVMVR